MSLIALCRFQFRDDQSRTSRAGIVVSDSIHVLPESMTGDLALTSILDAGSPIDRATELVSHCEQQVSLISPEIRFLSPLERQEVWGTGMTYHKAVDPHSQNLSLYEKAYLSDRPFFFYKSSAHVTAGSGGIIRVRPDSFNTIAEPELTVVLSSTGKIAGYTIGSDVTARDIEGENPLYQCLSKCYDGSCSVGPWIRLCSYSDLRNSVVRTRQVRGSEVIFRGETNLGQMVKTPETIAEWFLRGGQRPLGAAILTGNGVAFPADITLQAGDVVTHEIEGLGVQSATVA